MEAVDPIEHPGAAVRDARLELGWRHDDLAGEVARVRARRGLRALALDSVRRQVIGIQQGSQAVGPQWRSLLAEALDSTEERLFGLVLDAELPRPMLLEATVTPEVIDLILARREVHARTEHLFGPRHAQTLVAADMATIAQLVQIAPARFRADARRAAALVAELGGWIAQDSGDPQTALSLTADAEDYARRADPAVRAMILMRRSNILTRRDPALAVELGEDAADLIRGRPVGLLSAAIARQQALAAFAAGNRAGFGEHASYAADLAHAEPIDGDLARYASPAYVSSEAVPALIGIGQADQAVELLSPHVVAWPAGQQRDHAVASIRLLHALCHVGDYTAAIGNLEPALRGSRVAPSVRARNELRLVRKLLTDRARTDRSLPLSVLRGRVTDALLTDSSHG